MKSLEELYREKAGLDRPRDKAPLKGVDKAKLPDDPKPIRSIDLKIERPVDARTKLDLSRPTLPGDSGKTTDIVVNRPGSEGKVSDIDIERGGTDGRTLNIDTKRGGDLGTESDIEVTRGGELGETSEINSQRPESQKIENDPVITRGGTPGSTSEIKIERGGTEGNKSEVEITRGGTLGELSDIKIERPTQEEIKLTLESAGIPYDTNFFSLNEKNPYFKTQDVLDRINQISNQVQGWVRTIGFESSDITQVNNLLRTITQGKGVEVVTGFNANNEDLLAYFKFLMLNGSNWARIAIDLALRYAIIPASKELKEKLRKAALVKDGLDSEKFKKLHTNERRRDSIDRDIYLSDETGEFLGYYVNEGKLIQCTLAISSFLKNTNKEGDGYKYLQSNPTTSKGKFKGVPGSNFVTTRQKISDMTLASNQWWSVCLTRFDEDNELGFGGTLLPEFPEPFRNGWFPVTSVSFTKGDLTKKSFEFPFFKLEIPTSNERPRDLKLTLVDNETHDIRYWLDSYSRNCFDIDKNFVKPYKNLCWDLTVFQLDCTLQTIYKKNLIILLSEFSSTFDGSESFSGGTADEISLGFEIVGEYDEYDSEVNYPMN